MIRYARNWLLLSPALALIAASSISVQAHADTTRLEINHREPLNTPGTMAYELLTGIVHGEIDPGDSANAVINDLRLAPRNARGKVEYSATFALVKPVDMGRASGVLFYDTPNRGTWNQSQWNALDDVDGHMHLVSGWQGDIPPAPDRQTMTVPIASGPRGKAITGPVLVRFTDIPAGTASTPIVAGFGQGVPRPEPVTLDSTRARLVYKASDQDAGTAVPASDWAFADCSGQAFPGRPDPHSLCLRAGFDQRLAYELVYEARDPPVLGIGFAAVRDLVEFLKNGPDTADAPNPIAHQVRHAIITGVSQSGNFVRTFIHLGFNQGSDGRPVFDGAYPIIAARLVPLNLRFSVPGGAAGLYEPGSEGVVWWGDYDDRARGLGSGSLLRRCRASKTCPKVVEAFGSAEFWGLHMSPDLVGTDARTDIPLPANVRRYYLPAITHGGGRGGFESDPARLTPVRGCQLASNPNPAAATFRALAHALVQWVVADEPPPESVFPRLAQHQLVPVSEVTRNFPVWRGLPSPQGKLNEFLVYDFGKTFKKADISGAIGTLPPRIVATIPSLVPRVDVDGNETDGIRSAQLQAPLGTYLGWNVVTSGYHAGQGCGFLGGYVPFARSRAERLGNGDPRPSLEERYSSHEDFVARVREAAAQLVQQRFLLPDDAERVIQQALDSDVLAGESAAHSAR